jgi:hypothetical protein
MSNARLPMEIIEFIFSLVGDIRTLFNIKITCNRFLAKSSLPNFKVHVQKECVFIEQYNQILFIPEIDNTRFMKQKYIDKYFAEFNIVLKNSDIIFYKKSTNSRHCIVINKNISIYSCYLEN